MNDDYGVEEGEDHGLSTGPALTRPFIPDS
jgi:hypothetical protein